MMPTRARQRRGISLIELFVMITVTAVLLGLSGGLIKLLLKLDWSSRDALTLATDATRLTRAFRLDAHRATNPQPPTADGPRIGWALADDERVAYTIRPDDILREVYRGQQPTPRRELFRLPPRSTVQFETSNDSGRPIVAVVIRRLATAKLPALDDRTDAEFARLVRLTRRQP